MSSSPLPLQSLRGVIERITFYNEENGYTAARLVPEGKSYTVTVIGNLMGANVGESLLLVGVWQNRPQLTANSRSSAFRSNSPRRLKG